MSSFIKQSIPLYLTHFSQEYVPGPTLIVKKITRQQNTISFLKELTWKRPDIKVHITTGLDKSYERSRNAILGEKEKRVQVLQLLADITFHS